MHTNILRPGHFLNCHESCSTRRIRGRIRIDILVNLLTVVKNDSLCSKVLSQENLEPQNVSPPIQNQEHDTAADSFELPCASRGVNTRVSRRTL